MNENREISEKDQSKELPGLVSTLKHWVEIDSATSQRPGIDRMQAEVATKLKAMGFKCSFKPHPQGLFGPLLHARRPADDKEANGPRVTLVFHVDTVFDDLKEAPRLIEEGERLIGPGTADNKGGIVVALEGLRRYLEATGNNSPIHFQVVSSPNEEIGSDGFTSKFKKIGAQSDIVLGFEPSTAEGDIVTSRFGNRWYRIKCHGVEAHAGRANGEEVNAAHEMMAKIDQILALKEKYEDLKINVASFHGGSHRYNIVCGDMEAKIDVRFLSEETRKKVHREITQIVKKANVISKDGVKSQSEFFLEDDCPPLENCQQRLPKYIKAYLNAIESQEFRRVSAITVGGAADASYLSHGENIVIDGLGVTGGGMHTDHEYIETKSLVTRSQALAKFLSELI